jgi:hypothetical protein
MPRKSMPFHWPLVGATVDEVKVIGDPAGASATRFPASTNSPMPSLNCSDTPGEMVTVPEVTNRFPVTV